MKYYQSIIFFHVFVGCVGYAQNSPSLSQKADNLLSHYSEFHSKDSVFHRAEYLRLYPTDFNDLLKLIYQENAPLKGHSWRDLSVVSNTNDSLKKQKFALQLKLARTADWKNETIPFDDISIMQMTCIKAFEFHPRMSLEYLNSLNTDDLNSVLDFVFFPAHHPWPSLPEGIVSLKSEYQDILSVIEMKHKSALELDMKKKY